jgi:hypothetical protein
MKDTMIFGKAHVSPQALGLLAYALIACSSGARAKDTQNVEAPGIDAGTKTHQVTDASMHAPAIAADASMNAGAYSIYPVDGKCPAQAFPAGLQVHATTYCSGTTGACHDEVCHGDTDCTAQPFGRCAGVDEGAGAIEFTRCMYEQCLSNDDCATGSVCVCDGGWRYCVAAACTSNEDCPASEQCIRADTCGEGPFGPFLCTSPADECHVNSDCALRGTGNSCAAEDGHLKCISIICD